MQGMKVAYTLCRVRGTWEQFMEGMKGAKHYTVLYSQLRR